MLATVYKQTARRWHMRAAMPSRQPRRYRQAYSLTYTEANKHTYTHTHTHTHRQADIRQATQQKHIQSRQAVCPLDWLSADKPSASLTAFQQHDDQGVNSAPAPRPAYSLLLRTLPNNAHLGVLIEIKECACGYTFSVVSSFTHE